MTIAAYPKHNSFKPSGYDWIGDVPAHWDAEKLGSMLTAVSERNCPDLPLLSITREQGVIKRDIDDQESNHNFIPDDLTGYKVIRKGQFGMNKMKAWQGSYGVSEHTGIVSPAYFIFDFAREVDSRFFNIAIRSKLYVSYFGSASDGVRIGQWDLNQSRMRQIPILLPPLPEQRAIATFLDKKCAKIDEAVRIKEEQIKLLRERRQILIQQAVTRGLNPDAPMKDSGIDWIGQIPAHWEVKKLKYLCAFSGGGTPSKDRADFWTNGTIPWVSPKDMKTEYISTTQDKITGRALLESTANYIPVGSLLMVVRSGILQRKIPVAINLVKVTLNQDMKALVFQDQVCSQFMMSFIEGNNNKLLTILTKEGATVESVEHDYLANLLVTVPPWDEQKKIANFIESIASDYGSAVSIKQQQITALKEYKTTLINAAVTGKIRITPDMLSTSAN